MTAGISLREEDTLLARRAADLLASGPADDATLVAYVCSLPAPPLMVAERLAAAIFAGRPEFFRDEAGCWRLDAAAPSARAPQTSERGDESELLASLTFAVVDVETTGGQAYLGDRITEIAVVVVRDGEVAELYETLVNPERQIPPFVTRLTNITSEMVKDAPLFPEIAGEVMQRMAGRVFVAHNATFDWKFLTVEMRRAQGRQLVGRRLCTVRLARRLLPQLERRSLDHLAGYYGVSIARRHRAGGDALATAECLVRLLRDAHDRGCRTLADLDQLGRARRPKRRRPRGSPTPVTRDTTA